MPHRPTLVAAAVTGLLALAGAPARPDEPVAQPPRFTREQMEAALAKAPPFTFVYGTQDPAWTAVLRARATTLALRVFGSDSAHVVADRDVDARRFAAGPVYLLGGPGSNAWTRRLAGSLPVRFEPGGFLWQERRYDRPLDAIHLSWPNPLEPRWFLLLSAGNSPAAFARRAGFVFGDEDYRILRDGEVARSGRFSQAPGRSWRYDPALDRDREGERERYLRALEPRIRPGLRVLAPRGLGAAGPVGDAAAALLARLSATGFAAPAGATLELTLHASLEDKGRLTHDTRPEHLEAGDGPPAVQAALPAGRDRLDLWAPAAARLVQLGASPRSRLLRAAGAQLAGAFEGEPLTRATARLAAAGLLPGAAEAAGPDRGVWRSPLVTVPARALLVRALLETAPAAARREALLGWLRDDAPGTLDSLARRASVPVRALEARYRALADSLARLGPPTPARAARAPWRPGDGFQRGVCLAHSVGLERGYLSRGAVAQLARIREAGADWVSLTPFAWLADPRRPVLGVSADQGPDGESDEAVAEAAARAHALGLRVWLKPHVWTRGWAGELAYPPAGWARFFDAYEQVLLHWALLAEREGLDGLVVGHELASSTAADPARWRAMIAGVRRVYGGLLTYDANWDEVARIPFWDALDLIGVSFYTPIATRPTRDPRVLRRGAERALDALAPLAARHRRPVLLAELGYPAAPTAAVRPWQEPDGGEDAEAQRACLEATVGALEPREWVAGAFFWKWGSSERVEDAFDPRGRSAESVVTRALGSWQGRPVRLPRATRDADRDGRGRR